MQYSTWIDGYASSKTWPDIGFDFPFYSMCIHDTVNQFRWEHLNHQTGACLGKSLSADGDPTIQLSVDSWSHQRDFTATASDKNPKQWQEEGQQVFRRWAIHKHLQAGFFRLALRLGGSIHFLFLPHSDGGLSVPTALMTQNLRAAPNKIIQCSIMPRMEVVYCAFVLATISSHH